LEIHSLSEDKNIEMNEKTAMPPCHRGKDIPVILVNKVLDKQILLGNKEGRGGTMELYGENII
jgi:hypothetical protein